MRIMELLNVRVGRILEKFYVLFLIEEIVVLSYLLIFLKLVLVIVKIRIRVSFFRFLF